MFLINLESKITRPIFSLPEWHGARFGAWLRDACKQCPFSLEDVVAGIFPFGNRRTLFKKDESAILRLIMDEGKIFFLPALLKGLTQARGKGEFSAASFCLVRGKDAASGLIIWANGHPTGQNITSFSEASLAAEAEYLRSLAEWGLEFCSPLCLPMPAGNRRGRGIEKFSMPSDLEKMEGLENLLSRIRFVSPFSGLQLDLL